MVFIVTSAKASSSATGSLKEQVTWGNASCVSSAHSFKTTFPSSPHTLIIPTGENLSRYSHYPNHRVPQTNSTIIIFLLRTTKNENAMLSSHQTIATDRDLLTKWTEKPHAHEQIIIPCLFPCASLRYLGVQQNERLEDVRSNILQCILLTTFPPFFLLHLIIV